jgi:hypothetical protein
VNEFDEAVAVPELDIIEFAPDPVKVTVEPVAEVTISPAPVKVTVVPVAEPVVALRVTIPCVTPDPVIVNVLPVADVVIPLAPTTDIEFELAVAVPELDPNVCTAVLVKETVDPVADVDKITPSPLSVNEVPEIDPLLPIRVMELPEPPPDPLIPICDIINLLIL